MNNIDIFRLTIGLLQFGVAWYALRLVRLFKTTLLGWLLFGALAIMALLSLVLAVEPFDAAARWGIRVDIIYAVLLLAGLARFYPGLGNFLREEEAKRCALDKWEAQVREQWVELIKTNEKLRQTVSELETEITERKRAQEQAEKNLEASLAVAHHNGNGLPPDIAGTPTTVIEPQAAPETESPEMDGITLLDIPHPNGEASSPMDTDNDTEVIASELAPEPAEANDESLLSASSVYDEDSQPQINGLDTPTVVSEPVTAPVEPNGEPALSASSEHDKNPRPETIRLDTPTVVPEPATAPVEPNGEPVLSASSEHDKNPRPETIRLDTPTVVSEPTTAPVEPNGEPVLSASSEHDKDPRPETIRLDTPTVVSEPATAPVEPNGEPVLSEPLEIQDESWAAVCVPVRMSVRVPVREIARRKANGVSRKKPARTRSISRARGQKARAASSRR